MGLPSSEIGGTGPQKGAQHHVAGRPLTAALLVFMIHTSLVTYILWLWLHPFFLNADKAVIGVILPRTMYWPSFLLMISRDKGKCVWYEYAQYFKSFQFLHCLT